MMFFWDNKIRKKRKEVFCHENDISAKEKIQSESARIQSPHEHKRRA